MTPVLQVDELVKSFTLHGIGGRVVPAFAGVSLSVAAGEFVALAGKSGAGKSSLLKCIYRTYRPIAGSVVYRDSAGRSHDLTELPDDAMADLREHEIGYVSQFLRAEPRRGALDVVARAGARRGLDPTRAREAARTVLRRLNLDEDLWETYPTLLSGGEQQRVNLAAAILEPPRLLLLDEPVSALDPANREAVLQLVGELTQRQVAVLAVLHDLPAIRRLADRVVLLDHGGVAAAGRPDDVLPHLEGAPA